MSQSVENIHFFSNKHHIFIKIIKNGLIPSTYEAREPWIGALDSNQVPGADHWSKKSGFGDELLDPGRWSRTEPDQILDLVPSSEDNRIFAQLWMEPIELDQILDLVPSSEDQSIQ